MMDFIRNLPKAFQPSKTLIPNKILTLTKPTEIYELFSRLTELITVWVFFDNNKIQSYIRLEREIFEDFWNPGEILEGPITAFILRGFFFLRWFFFLIIVSFVFLALVQVSITLHVQSHNIAWVPCSHSMSFLALDVRWMWALKNKIDTQKSKYFTNTFKGKDKRGSKHRERIFPDSRALYWHSVDIS